MNVFSGRFARPIVAALTTALVILAVISILRAGLAFWLYSYIAKWATVRLGLDYYLSELLAVAVTSAVMFMLPGIGFLILSRKKRFVGMITIIGGVALVSIMVYTVGREVYFNRVTGESLRYYADTPEGREFSFTPGFHPKYGIPFKPYTREMMNEELERGRRQGTEQRKNKPANTSQHQTEALRREQHQHRTHEIKQRKRELEPAPLNR
jgi:hypothetical protein